MKKLLLLLSLFIGISISAQTNMAEFNYIKKEYKNKLENGHTPKKKAYLFEEIERLDYGDEKQAYNFVLTRMVHEEKGLKAIILSYYNKGKLETFCLPHPDTSDQVWITAIRDFNDFWSEKKNFPLLSSLFMKLMYLAQEEFQEE